MIVDEEREGKYQPTNSKEEGKKKRKLVDVMNLPRCRGNCLQHFLFHGIYSVARKFICKTHIFFLGVRSRNYE